MSAATLAAWLCLAASAQGAALDWPHLRGPTYNAVSGETGIAERWPEGGPRVLWRVELGQGYSGIVAVGGRLYTQMQSVSGQYVVCLDAATGRRVWRRRYGYAWEPEGHWPGPYATPTVRGGRVYFAGCYGLVGCLRASDGRVLWSLNVTERFEGEGTEYGYACTPLVEGGKVFVPVGGAGASVVALSADDGSVAWRSGDEPASYSPAYPITVGGQRQIVTFLQNVVVGLDPATGSQLWEHRWSSGYDEHAAWPVYHEPYLLTAAAFRNGATVLRLERDKPAAVAWKSEALSNDIFSSLILDGHIYGFDLHDFQPRHTRAARGRLKCIELATGKARWVSDRTGHANVLAADGKLILFNDTGELILARATPERYEELARARVFEGDVCWTAPTLCRGRLYVRNHKEAVCLWLGDPARAPAAAASAAPRALGMWGRYEALCTDSSLYAPTLGDAARWYAWCVVGVLVPSALAAFLLGAAARRRAGWAWATRALAFGVCAFLIGAGGTIGFSLWAGRFVFTWPVSLFVGYQAVVWGAAAARRGGGRWARWLVRGSVVGFLALCAGYVALCGGEHLPNIPVGYGFLVGVLPAFPVAALAARRLAARAGALSAGWWVFLSFSLYYWASAVFTVWRT